MIRHWSVILALVPLAGCASLFRYPELPPAKPPVTLTAAIDRAQQLEVDYLSAANDQVMAAKIANLGFLGAGATAIGGALYGSHRDVITGAAFGGGIIYAGSTLFGSQAQRNTYRTGAQALSCAITRYAPLLAVDETGLKAGYANIVANDKIYRQKAMALENSLAALPDKAAIPLPNAALPASHTATDAAAHTALASLRTAQGKLPAALMANASVTDIADARSALNQARKDVSAYGLQMATALGELDGFASAEQVKATEIQNTLKDLLAKPGLSPADAALLYNALQATNAYLDAAKKRDRALVAWTKMVLQAYDAGGRAQLNLTAWRLSEPAVRQIRRNTLTLIQSLDAAGTGLSGLVDSIHIKVVNELERAEPDRRSILEALGSSVGVVTNYARTTGASLREATPPAVLPVALAGGGGGGGGFAAAAVGTPNRAAAAGHTIQEQGKDLEAQLKNLQPMPALASEEARFARSMAALGPLVMQVDADEAAARRAKAGIDDAVITAADAAETVSNVNSEAVRSECEQLINPGIEPLGTSTNQVLVTATTSVPLFVYGGTPPYRVEISPVLDKVKVEPGYDPASGQFRYLVSGEAGLTGGATYTMKVRDRRGGTAPDVTITTK